MMAKLSRRTNFLCAAPAYLKDMVRRTLSDLHKHNCLLGTRDYWHFIENNKQANKTVDQQAHKPTDTEKPTRLRQRAI